MVVVQVEDHLEAPRSWTSNPRQSPLSLAHVRALLWVLDELLHLLLPLGSTTGTLLDRFLVLTDAFGFFLAALLTLRQYASDLCTTMLRHDHTNVTSTTRKQRQLNKELEQLAAAMAREAVRCSTSRANLSWAMEASSYYQFGNESV
jgi:hypothetical protein